jgi:hypothetical protein
MFFQSRKQFTRIIYENFRLKISSTLLSHIFVLRSIRVIWIKRSKCFYLGNIASKISLFKLKTPTRTLLQLHERISIDNDLRAVVHNNADVHKSHDYSCCLLSQQSSVSPLTFRTRQADKNDNNKYLLRWRQKDSHAKRDEWINSGCFALAITVISFCGRIFMHYN